MKRKLPPILFGAIGSLLLAIPALPVDLYPFFIIAALVLYIRFGFAYFSRRMERQADLEALRVQGTSRSLVAALERIGQLSGGIRHAKSWHHMSIAERVSFLRAAEANPALAEGHHRHTFGTMRLGVAAAVALLLVLSLQPDLPPPGHRPLARAPTVQDWQQHYQRLSWLLPDDPAGPLGLVDHLHGTDPSAALAAAREALRRASTEPDRLRAAAWVAQLSSTPADPQ